MKRSYAVFRTLLLISVVAHVVAEITTESDRHVCDKPRNSIGMLTCSVSSFFFASLLASFLPRWFTVAENCLPGSPSNEWDVNGAGHPGEIVGSYAYLYCIFSIDALAFVSGSTVMLHPFVYQMNSRFCRYTGVCGSDQL